MEYLSKLSIELLAALIPLVIGIVKSFKFVQEGEQGIKLTFGRAKKNRDGTPRIIQPGFAFLIPWVQTLKRHHVRQQTQRLDHQKVMVDGGLIFNVSAIVIYRVRDIYKALFEIDDLDNSVIDVARGILRDVLADKKPADLTDISAISANLLERLKIKADQWGVEFLQFNMTDCAPDNQSAPLVAASAGVRLKMEALRTAAKDCNVQLQDLSPVLAAALIGAPLVTSISPVVMQNGSARLSPGAVEAAS